jgi:uncharacterized protein YoxC
MEMPERAHLCSPAPELRDDLNRTHQDVNGLTAAVEDLREKLTTLAEGLSSQTELQGMTNRTTDDRIGGLAQGIDRVVNTIDGLTRAIEGLDNRIITLERKDRDG